MDLGIGPPKGVIFGHPSVTKGELVAQLCKSARTVGASVWSGALGRQGIGGDAACFQILWAVLFTVIIITVKSSG